MQIKRVLIFAVGLTTCLMAAEAYKCSGCMHKGKCRKYFSEWNDRSEYFQITYKCRTYEKAGQHITEKIILRTRCLTKKRKLINPGGTWLEPSNCVRYRCVSKGDRKSVNMRRDIVRLLCRINKQCLQDGETYIKDCNRYRCKVNGNTWKSEYIRRVANCFKKGYSM